MISRQADIWRAGRDRETIRFDVAGVPAPQGSKTRTQGHVREDNPQTLPWRNAVAAAAQEAMSGRPPLTGPLYLEAEFRFPRPKSHWRVGSYAGHLKRSAPTSVKTRPDLDKLLRAVGDALTGVVCVDDAEFAEVYAMKTYGLPGLTVVVCEMTP